ncbi:MAG: ABC transporter ATP-binding protein [Actinobacteria bacterium]|nr:ABC transporter ATP-binding protein [Actinomycetota bacterium]
MSENILSVKNLSFSYNSENILDNISFEISRGSFVSILGPNGAGKSTLVNIISKVLKDFEGSIIVEGKNLKLMTSRELARNMAVVPQYTEPGFGFTVEEMVMMGRHPYISRFGGERPEDYSVVREVMDKTSTAQFANRRFTQLSGGEKQRVVIAQALAQESPILLLDEPTSHLDINFQIELMNLFLKLNREEGKTIIGVFHDINLAIQNSSMIMLLKDGGIFGFGRPEDMINRQNLKNVFHSDVFVGRNPVTRKMYVSPVFDPGYAAAFGPCHTPKTEKLLKVHVIGGGGAASPVIDLLYRNGHHLSCGVVNTFDTDLDTCRMLDIPYIVEAPFSPISLTSQSRNIEFIKASDVVVLPEIEFGNGNFSNLVAVKEALGLNKKVLVIDGGDIEKRDHTGGKAKKLYEKLLSEGTICVKKKEELLEYL